MFLPALSRIVPLLAASSCSCSIFDGSSKSGTPANAVDGPAGDHGGYLDGESAFWGSNPPADSVVGSLFAEPPSVSPLVLRGLSFLIFKILITILLHSFFRVTTPHHYLVVDPCEVKPVFDSHCEVLHAIYLF